MERLAFCALGTEIRLASSGPAAGRRLLRARRWLEAYERRFSRFLPSSEVSRLNASAGQPFRVSPRLSEFLNLNLSLRHSSGGVFDPFMLQQLEAAGYDRTWTPGATWEITKGRPHAAGEIRFDPLKLTVTLPAGCGFDPGGLGKGWAADQVARILGPNCMVDCGGDIALRGEPEPGRPWFIGIQDPWRPAQDLTVVALQDAGIATSSVLRRTWQTASGSAHHLIDASTGRPSQTDLAAVTIIAPSATLADFHAKVALLLGSQDGCAYVEKQRGIEALMATRSGTLLRSSGFPAFEVQAA